MQRPSQRPPSIKYFFSTLVHATPEFCSKMNVVLNVKKGIRRFRHENRCNLPISTGLDLSYFELPVKHMQKLNEEHVPLEISVGQGSEKRYFVFDTSNKIVVINSYGHWFIDGTFDGELSGKLIPNLHSIFVYIYAGSAERFPACTYFTRTMGKTIQCTLVQSKVRRKSSSFCF